MNALQRLKTGLLALSILCLPVLLTACTKTVKLSDYIKYDVEGYDGKGTITAEFNYRALMSDEDIKKEDSKILSDFTVEVDPEGDLSNGDEVTLTVEVPEGAEKSLKLKFTEPSLTITVEDLEGFEEKDPFEGINVTFSGGNGVAEARLELGESQLPESVFSLSQTTNLYNGDTVVVTLKDYNQDAFTAEYGFIPVPLEKSFTVTGQESIPARNYIDDLLISFEGTEPEGKLRYKLSDDAVLPANEYSVDKAEDFSNGDTLTVFLVKDNIYYLETYGYVPEIRTKTYTVEGLAKAGEAQASEAPAAQEAPAESQASEAQASGAPAAQEVPAESQASEAQTSETPAAQEAPAESATGGYVTMGSQLTAEILDTLKADAEARIRQRELDTMNHASETLNSVYFIETVLMVSGSDASPHNAIYVIFRNTAGNNNGEFSWYDCFRYTDLTIDASGKVSVDLNTATGLYGRHTVEDRRSAYYYYSGYATLEEVRNFAKTELGSGYSPK